MKKRYRYVAVVCLMVVIILAFMQRHKFLPTAAANLPATQTQVTVAVGDQADREPEDAEFSTKSRARNSNVEVEAQSREEGQVGETDSSFEGNVHRATVSAELEAGETLVTGGYRLANGSIELTMITPSSVTLPNGKEGIKMHVRVLMVEPDFVEANRMSALATLEEDTLQHGERWSQKGVEETLRAAQMSGRVGAMTAPSIADLPGSPMEMELHTPDGYRYSVHATMHKNSIGGYQVQAHVERAEPSPQP